MDLRLRRLHSRPRSGGGAWHPVHRPPRPRTVVTHGATLSRPIVDAGNSVQDAPGHVSFIVPSRRGDPGSKTLPSTPIRTCAQIFLTPRSAHNSARQFGVFQCPTALSTAGSNPRKTLTKSIRTHSLSTLNPQLVQVDISPHATLDVGHAPGGRPKYSALFLAQFSWPAYKGARPRSGYESTQLHEGSRRASHRPARAVTLVNGPGSIAS
jgi:hypothetical protein